MPDSHETYPDDFPEEYKTGKVVFFGREFSITPHVLIPRLETEMLVRRARNILTQETFDMIVDIGTGSGIIGVSCADLIDEVIFLDVSPLALEVAERNFRTHFPQKKAKFIVSDLLSHFPSQKESSALFLANLPYIREDDWENMSTDTHHEPRIALFGGQKTGFEIYERFFQELSHETASGGYGNVRIIIEFGFDQREVAEEEIKKYGWKYEFFSDYAGIERFCEITIDTGIFKEPFSRT